MIKTIDISKTFKIKYKVIKAVDDVSFEIERNTAGALVGPNGAGKTTMIKMLSTLIIPSSGDAIVNGYSITREEKKLENQ